MIDVDALAQEIRRVDGKHSLGAGQLAEALMPFIKAALAAMPQPVAVKPLEWLSDVSPFTADSPFCYYRVEPVNDDTGPHWETTIKYTGSVYRRHETEAEAKAAAQADYERRVLSSLTTPAQGAQPSEEDDAVDIASDALQDSMDVDWNCQVGARAVVKALNDAGLINGASDNDVAAAMDVIGGFLAWGGEPDPESKSIRDRQLSVVWAKARALIALRNERRRAGGAA